VGNSSKKWITPATTCLDYTPQRGVREVADRTRLTEELKGKAYLCNNNIKMDLREIEWDGVD
jgi:hypothetical protein